MGEQSALRPSKNTARRSEDSGDTDNDVFAASADELRAATTRRQRFVRSNQYSDVADETASPARSSHANTESRISADVRMMITELSRMADRVIDAREQLAHAQHQNTQLTEQLAGANQRLLAARAIVHDARNAAQAAAERCEFLEGRCDALQDALDLALHAGIVARWKWRRRLRATAGGGPQ